MLARIRARWSALPNTTRCQRVITAGGLVMAAVLVVLLVIDAPAGQRWVLVAVWAAWLAVAGLLALRAERRE